MKIYPTESWAHEHHEAHTGMFIEVFFVITQKCEQLRNPRTRDRKNKLVIPTFAEASKLFLERATSHMVSVTTTQLCL